MSHGVKMTLRSFERSLPAHQDCQVGLRRPSDHVGDEALVSGGVQDGEMFLFRLKVSSPNLHRLPFVPLLLVCVQSPRQVPATMFINLNKSICRFSFAVKMKHVSGPFADVGQSSEISPCLPVLFLCFSFIFLQGSLFHHSSQVPVEDDKRDDMKRCK